jgi:hypothetical protein
MIFKASARNRLILDWCVPMLRFSPTKTSVDLASGFSRGMQPAGQGPLARPDKISGPERTTCKPSEP